VSAGDHVPPPPWLRALLRAIRPFLPVDFVGRIEINVFRGRTANANLTQSFRDDSSDGAPRAPASQRPPGRPRRRAAAPPLRE
jgi:hypothetical protein